MIPTEREPEDEPVFHLERCCFCRERTRFWTKIARRTPGQQVACCEPCAKSRKVVEVPTKDEWCDKEAKLEGHGRRQAGDCRGAYCR